MFKIHHYILNLDGLTWIITWIYKAAQKEQLVETFKSDPSEFHNEEEEATNINLIDLPVGVQEADDWPYPSLLPNETIHLWHYAHFSNKEQILQSLCIYHFDCMQFETNTSITITQL